MSDLPPPGGRGAAHGLPDPPPGPPPGGGEPLPPRPSYEHWTREPVVHVGIALRGEPIGRLWAAPRHPAAGLVLRPGASPAVMDAAEVWEDRLAEAYEAGLPALDALRHLTGAPEDPVGGAIPAGEEERRAASLDALYELVAPGTRAPEGPLVQDGTFPDGTPVDRAQDWGPLVSVTPPTYPEETAGPVRYVPAFLEGRVVGYVWASHDDCAAGYVERPAARKDAQVAGGWWRLWLSRAFAERLPSVEALRRCKLVPEDRLSGVIGGAAPEHEAPSLDTLREQARG